MSVAQVLVATASPGVAAGVRGAFADEGMGVAVVADAVSALHLAVSVPYRVLVLDAQLDGVATCRRLRAEGVTTPVVLLTASAAADERVAGIEAGVDDNLTVPFAADELVAHVRALARRVPAQTLLTAGDLGLDVVRRRAHRGGVPIHLSQREFALLQALVADAGRVLHRRTLLERVWQDTAAERSNVVDVYIGYLRAKVDRPFGVRSIETIRGTGYRMRADGGRA